MGFDWHKLHETARVPASDDRDCILKVWRQGRNGGCDQCGMNLPRMAVISKLRQFRQIRRDRSRLRFVKFVAFELALFGKHTDKLLGD